MSETLNKKAIAKAYGEYVKQFTPKPAYAKNWTAAFITGGGLCMIAKSWNDILIGDGISKEDAGTLVTIGFIICAQLLTGIGIFDKIAKFAGAGVIVPISGFANAIAAPAIEYKKEGLILGAGSKLFVVSGPVLVCGMTSATFVGLIYWLIG